MYLTSGEAAIVPGLFGVEPFTPAHPVPMVFSVNISLS